MSDPMEVTEEEVSDVSDILEDADVEVREPKGPNPAIWGDPEERYQADIEAGKISPEDQINKVIAEKLASGEEPIVELEGGGVVKGPDPTIWSIPDDPVLDEEPDPVEE